MRRLAPLLVVLTLGCGSDPTPAGAGESSGESSGSSGGTGAPELPIVCDGAPSQFDPLNGAEACDDLRSVAVGEEEPPIEIEIVNLTDDAILLPDRASGCQHTPRPFTLTGLAGTRTATTPSESCAADWPICDLYLGIGESGCLGCGSLPQPRRIEAGGRHLLQWRPQIVVDATMPASCNVLEDAEVACGVAMRAPLGQYELEALGAPSSTCAAACADAPDADGSCIAEELANGCEHTLSARTTWDGACRNLAIVFGDPR